MIEQVVALPTPPKGEGPSPGRRGEKIYRHIAGQ